MYQRTARIVSYLAGAAMIAFTTPAFAQQAPSSGADLCPEVPDTTGTPAPQTRAPTQANVQAPVTTTYTDSRGNRVETTTNPDGSVRTVTRNPQGQVISTNNRPGTGAATPTKGGTRQPGSNTGTGRGATAGGAAAGGAATPTRPGATTPARPGATTPARPGATPTPTAGLAMPTGNAAQCSRGLSLARGDRASVNRALAARAVLQAAATRYGIDWKFLAAIGIRETGFRNIDNPNPKDPGWGYFQLTRQPGVSYAQARDLTFSANYAARMLANNMRYLRSRYPRFTQAQLLQATAASYNFGTDDVSGNPNTIDVGTTRNNYGQSIVLMMNCF